MNLLDEKIYANALNLIPQLGPVSLNKLTAHFGSFAKAWQGQPSDYVLAGIKRETVDQIIPFKRKINPEQSFAEVTRRQIEILLSLEKSYPQLLKEIMPVPPILYVRGKKEVLNSTAVAVVGTRKMSSYGQLACDEIAMGLSSNGITIVSGLAFGVDAVALQAAVTNSGRGIAVLASDLDNYSIAPRANFNLAQKILENGCLVSEYALGSSTQRQNFPIRNRIISGLSLGTLVVEADAESGALITAGFALEQNREVFAIPGSIFSPTSRGTNQLIKQGAKLVSSAYDILEELNLDSNNLPDAPQIADTSETEAEILKFLTKNPLHIDDLIKTVKLTPQQVNANLTLLEMKGRVKNLGGAKYVKIR
ncbi:MAG: DNA-processing protein DprA [Candidatus Doudnabacteria bacterium]|nr:DNA-processing protein DprA [Candidatus Doudnabacteria bacterium]